MRGSRTLFWYLLREVIAYAALGFAVFASILLVQNVLRRLGDLAAVGLTASDTLTLLGCLFPMLAAYAVPVAFLFGVLVALGRLSVDHEIVALRACGIGLGGLLKPVLALAVAFSLGSAVLIGEAAPRAKMRLREVLQDVASRGALIDPGRFRRLGKTRVFFVESRDRENRLEKIFLDDRTNPEHPTRLFAEKGRFGFDRERSKIVLKLENGEIHAEPELDAGGELRTRRISFHSFDYEIDAEAVFGTRRDMRPYFLTTGELFEAVRLANAGPLPAEYPERDPDAYRIQLHRRLALPLAPLVFALIGVALGIRPTRGARSWGTLLCVAIAFAYYVLLAVGHFLAEESLAPPALALWLPNLVLGTLALGLLRRAARGAS